MEVKPEEIQELLEYFSKNTYKAKDTHPKVQRIMKKCLGLFSLDYNYSVLSNNGGELSTNYPSSIVILESEKTNASCSPLVTKSCNGSTNPTKSVHFMDNEVAANSTHISQSTKTNGDGVSPTNYLMKTEANGDAATNDDGRCQENCTTRVDGIHEESSTSSVNSLEATIKDESDLNSVFIETTDFQLDPVDRLSMNTDFNGGGVDLPINLGESCVTSSTISDFSSVGTENAIEVSKLKDLCSRARFARCRARFAIPVILYNKKHICRSATLSGGPEIYGRSSFDYLFSGGIDWKQFAEDDDEEIILPEARSQSEWQLFDRVRSQDIKLLKVFQVQTIVDFMVEKKKVKFGVYVTSSEKVDKENRYSDFTIVSLPYPGCEFFKKYRDNGYNGEDLIFEWNQTHVDADIFVPPDPITTPMNTDWTAYRKWDLIVLTQNYLKLLLAYLREDENGLLIHCISGWDRTPLFVSLLRLSLWADGVIHKSLCAEQILYLTLAYDWLLFGHNLEDRLNKGEEILFFCFYFLKYIVSCEYNVEGSKEVPKSHQNNARTRNDSDVQLDGVLLEAGSLTSPDGSSWSLSSCSSTSDKSTDNPPAYFNVEPESWDESLGAHHLHNAKNKNNSEMETSFAQALADVDDDETDCGPINTNYGSSSSALGAFSNSLVFCDGFNGNQKLSMQPNSNQATNVAHSDIEVSSSNSHLSSGLSVQNGNSVGKHCQSRTSPVAVPRSSRTAHHRHESSSSASIGSWQFVTGVGSLRETISSSDPGSSHSHPSRLSVSSAMECIETSESSCTLVEELTPVEFPERHPLASFDSNYGVPSPINGSKNGSEKVDKNQLKDGKVLSGSQSSASNSSATPASNQQSVGSNSRNSFMSRRRERLQTVRAHFYSLYSTAIGFQFKNANDNGSGGLGSLIGNFATKVGIRSAHRHMS